MHLQDPDLSQYQFIILDSVNDLGLKINEYKNLRKDHPDKAFIIILQHTKAGDFKVEKDWEHIAEIAVEVHKGVGTVTKNRYAPKNTLDFFMECACIDYESKLLETKSRIVESEAKGESWLQRNWRPMLMWASVCLLCSTFFVLVPYFNLPVTTLDDHIWTLMDLGVGGYVAGRSLEKISENLGLVLYNLKKKKN